MAANIGRRTKWPTRREDGMERDDGCRDGSVRECESVCYERATTGLQENPSTRSAPWRLGHSTIGPSGDTSGGMDFDSIRLVSNGIDSSRIDSIRLHSTRLDSILASVHTCPTDQRFFQIKRKVFVRDGSSELEGEPK